ncbi:MAG: hypothetical protein KF836_11955 [Fimbriimonadaceae bacterium]|nr:hypothetical protein [Fimbriimonadaceae bacterium]
MIRTIQSYGEIIVNMGPIKSVGVVACTIGLVLMGCAPKKPILTSKELGGTEVLLNGRKTEAALYEVDGTLAVYLPNLSAYADSEGPSLLILNDSGFPVDFEKADYVIDKDEIKIYSFGIGTNLQSKTAGNALLPSLKGNEFTFAMTEQRLITIQLDNYWRSHVDTLLKRRDRKIEESRRRLNNALNK